MLTALTATLLVLPAPMASAGLLAQVYQTGPAFIIDSESAPFGNASAELARGEIVGAGSYSYVGSAYANSTRGSIGVAAQATGSGYDVTSDRVVVHSRASLADAFIFNISGDVTFRLDVHGSFAGNFGGSMSSEAELQLFCGGCNATANSFWRGGNSFFNVSTNETVISRLPSNYQVWLETTIGVTANIPVPFEAMLEVYVAPPVTGDARTVRSNCTIDAVVTERHDLHLANRRLFAARPAADTDGERTTDGVDRAGITGATAWQAAFGVAAESLAFAC